MYFNKNHSFNYNLLKRYQSHEDSIDEKIDIKENYQADADLDNIPLSFPEDSDHNKSEYSDEIINDEAIKDSKKEFADHISDELFCDNHDEGKVEELDDNYDCTFISENPEYDINNSIQGTYFFYHSNAVACNEDNSAYFIIANSNNSEVNITLNTIDYTNLSGSKLSISSISSVKLQGDFSRKSDVISCSKDSMPPKCQIYSGYNSTIVEGIKNNVLYANPFSTYNEKYNGSVNILPGDAYAIEIKSSGPENSMFIFSVTWWEEEL